MPRPLDGQKLLQIWQWGQPTQAETTIDEAIALCQRFGFTGVSVKALDGATWMGNVEGQQNQPEALRGVVDARRQANACHAAGLYYAVWVNPLGRSTLEPELVGALAGADDIDAVFLDVEPYDQFWGAHQPVGAARAYMERIRQLAPNAYLVLQPDPRPARFAEIKPEEWLPYVNAVSGQHYFSTFQSNPDGEMDAAVDLGGMYNVPVFPTLPSGSTPTADLVRAVARLRYHGVGGLVLWRMGDANADQLAAVGAFVAGPTDPEPGPEPPVIDVPAIRQLLQETRERLDRIEGLLP